MHGLYIVEHLWRGVLIDQEWEGDRELDSSSVYSGWRSRWSPTRSRSEACHFDLARAQRAVERISPRQRPLVSILEYGTWEKVA